MGCCQAIPAPPPEASAEQRAICLRENALGYSKHRVRPLMEELIRLGDDGKFSLNDLNILGVKFELNLKELDDLDSEINAFYRNFKAERGAMRINALGALIVLLSKGTPQEKAPFLYRLMQDVTQPPPPVCDAETVRKLLTLLVDVACFWLPKLSQTETLTEGSLPADKVAALLESAREKKDKAIDGLLANLMNRQAGLSQQDFEARIPTSQLKVLTNAYELRTAVLG